MTKRTKSGRIGRVVARHEIKGIGVMYELAFENQIYTECYWESELS